MALHEATQTSSKALASVRMTHTILKVGIKGKHLVMNPVSFNHTAQDKIMGNKVWWGNWGVGDGGGGVATGSFALGRHLGM